MKKISVFLLIAVISVFSGNPFRVYAESGGEQTDYLIEFELFSQTETAKVFNEHRDEILNYFNNCVETARKGAGNDSYALFFSMRRILILRTTAK